MRHMASHTSASAPVDISWYLVDISYHQLSVLSMQQGLWKVIIPASTWDKYLGTHYTSLHITCNHLYLCTEVLTAILPMNCTGPITSSLPSSGRARTSTGSSWVMQQVWHLLMRWICFQTSWAQLDIYRPSRLLTSLHRCNGINGAPKLSSSCSVTLSLGRRIWRYRGLSGSHEWHQLGSHLAATCQTSSQPCSHAAVKPAALLFSPRPSRWSCCEGSCITSKSPGWCIIIPEAVDSPLTSTKLPRTEVKSAKRKDDFERVRRYETIWDDKGASEIIIFCGRKCW